MYVLMFEYTQWDVKYFKITILSLLVTEVFDVIWICLNSEYLVFED